MTPAQLLKIMPDAGRQADVFAAPLTDAMQRFNITGPARQASFLAQIAHESSQLNRMSENLNYRTFERLNAVWPKRFPTPQSTVGYIGNAPALANKVYGGRMGNGPEASGDGYRFRGRGLLQITGKDNYLACGAKIGYDLVAHPEFLDSPMLAALSAAWFWSANGLNELADKGDQTAVTKRINGGVHGLAQRLAMFELARKVLA